MARLRDATFASTKVFRGSDLTIARTLRDYCRANLYTWASNLANQINTMEQIDAQDQLSVPEAFDQDGSYVDFSQLTPQAPPFVHTLCTGWRLHDRASRKVRQYDAWVVLVTGLEVPEKVAAAHAVVAEMLALMFEEPLKEHIRTQGAGITDVSIVDISTQEASASDLGYTLSGGSPAARPGVVPGASPGGSNTLLRETSYQLAALKQSARVLEGFTPAPPALGDFDLDFDNDFF